MLIFEVQTNSYFMHLVRLTGGPSTAAIKLGGGLVERSIAAGTVIDA